MRDDESSAQISIEQQLAPIFKCSPRKLELRKKLYDERKEERVCVECTAKLPGKHRGNRCADCQERRGISERIYRLTPKGRKNGRVQKKRQRDRRVEAGLCTRCSEPRATWEEPGPTQKPNADSETCPACRRDMQAINVAWRERKAQGLVLTKEERRERWSEQRAELKSELRGTNYTPIDETERKPGIKILRALRRLDWASAEEVFVACGVPDFDPDDHAERDNYQHHLTRLVDRGHLLRQELIDRTFALGAKYEYRIAEAGRAVLAKAGI